MVTKTTTTMNCPVCDDPNVSEGAESCSNCGSDLRAFHDIQRVQSQRRNYRTASIILGVLLLIGFVTIAMTGMNIRTEASNDSSASPLAVNVEPNAFEKIEELKAVLIKREEHITELEKEVTELIATMQSSHEDIDTPEETIHVVAEGESLWSISEMYHGHGWEHANIAGHNEVENIHHIEVGDTIIIHH